VQDPAYPGSARPYGSHHLSWQELTADTLVSRVPILVAGVVVTSAGVAVTTATFYNGVNALASRSFRVLAPTTASNLIMFPYPVLFPNGLFVDVDANVASVLVLYIPLSDQPEAVS
jgi:hypothetical protein